MTCGKETAKKVLANSDASANHHRRYRPPSLIQIDAQYVSSFLPTTLGVDVGPESLLVATGSGSDR
jgi:hypothetical protein